MNERRHFKHFAGICGSFGFVEGGLSSSISVVRASFTNEGTFGTFQAVAAVSGSLGGNVSGLPFLLLVFHERTKTF